MIIELPKYVDEDTISYIKETVYPFTPKNSKHAYNRNGKTISISNTTELKELDNKLEKIFSDVQNNIIHHRYKPSFDSGDNGYEYHLYEPGDICHCHGDGEIVFNKENNTAGLMRYASVILHLNTVDNGGELIFPHQNKSIKTESGKIVVFPPYNMYQHYTTPSVQPREVIVTWFVYSGLTIYKT
jgi:hypothetical protein